MLVGDGQFFPEGGTLFTGELCPREGTIFPERGHYSLVNFVQGGQNSLVNNVRGTKITSE